LPRKARIRAIEYYLPDASLSNDAISREYPAWTVGDIAAKTGIIERHIAREDECASDLAVAAANKLFANGCCVPADVDFVLLCTQSPDYFLPTTACLLQERLAIPTSAGALDFNLGCSGFVYGLGLAKGLIETSQSRRVLFITAETYTKFIEADDRSTRTIFGDGAAATLIEGIESEEEFIYVPVYGTDGSGAKKLIVEGGAMRDPHKKPRLVMVGPDVFTFTIRRVPTLIQETLDRASLRLSDIDLFVFHQANQYMIEHLRAKLNIPKEKFVICLERCGNTVSSTIPIALNEAAQSERLRPGMKVMVVGFGVGYSWGAAVLSW
jgi:3-oxoacyl-[acyl-carrier-protein] synthase III